MKRMTPRSRKTSLKAEAVLTHQDSDLGLVISESLDYSHQRLTDELSELKLGGHWQTNEQVLEVDLSFNEMTVLPESLSMFNNLNKLFLSSNKITEVPDWISLFTALDTLYLNFNQIQRVPGSLATMTQLRMLRLNGNRLECLPASWVSLRHVIHPTDLRDNPLSQLPEPVRRAIASPSLDPLWAYLSDSAREGDERWRSVKVMVLGKEGSGKTHLMKRLKGSMRHDNLSTDGIDVERFNIGKAKTKISLIWFDFGGQQIYYPTHQLFLTNQCVYVVVFSLIDPDWDSRVRYWLHVIRGLTTGPGSPAPSALVALLTSRQDYRIVVTGTHLDKVKRGAADAIMKRLEKLTAQKHEIVFVSNTKLLGSKLGEFEESLRRAISDAGLDRLSVPVCYHKVMALVQGLSEQTLGWKQLMGVFDAAKLLSEYSEEMLQRAVGFLHNMGTLFYSMEHELVVLDPQWLSKRFADIISFKHNFAARGEASVEALRHIWPNLELREMLTSLFETFQIGFLATAVGPFIIPSLLPDEEPGDTYVHPKMFACSRRYSSASLPLGFLGHFMFAVRRLYPVLVMWRRGFQLHDALVRCPSGDLLLVYAQPHIIGALSSILSSCCGVDLTETIICPHCPRDSESARLIESEERDALLIANALGSTSTFKCGSEDVSIDLLGDDMSFGKLPVILPADFSTGAPLGEGRRRSVLRGSWRGLQVAVKRPRQTSLDSFRAHVALAHALSHQNLVAVLAITVQPEWLVLEELCEGGRLSDSLERVSTSEQRLRILLDVSAGLAALHSRGVSARGLCPSHVLLCSLDASADVCAKISEFGPSRGAEDPPSFSAPELLRQTPYALSCDMYSYAMLMYQLYTCRDPFTDSVFDVYRGRTLRPLVQYCAVCAKEWFQANQLPDKGKKGEQLVKQHCGDPPACQMLKECQQTFTLCAAPSTCCKEWMFNFVEDFGVTVVVAGAPRPPSCSMQCPSSKLTVNTRVCFPGYFEELEAMQWAVSGGLVPRMPPGCPDIYMELTSIQPVERPSFEEVRQRLSGGTFTRELRLEASHTMQLYEMPRSPIAAAYVGNNLYIGTTDVVYKFDLLSKELVSQQEVAGRLESLIADRHGRIWSGGTHLCRDGQIIVENADVVALALQDDSLISGHADGTVRTYDLQGAKTQQKKISKDPILCICGGFLGTRKGLLNHLVPFGRNAALERAGVRCLAGTPGKLWVCARDSADVWVFARRNLGLLRHYPGVMRDKVRVLHAVALQGHQYVFAGCQGQLAAFNAETLSQAFHLEVQGAVRTVASPDGVDLWISVGNHLVQVVLAAHKAFV